MQEAGDDHFGFVKAFLYGNFPADIRHTVGVLDAVLLLVRMRVQIYRRVEFLFQESFRLSYFVKRYSRSK